MKLSEIKKKWPMAVNSVFEIRNNLIGATWKYDDAEADSIRDERKFHQNHLNDGIYLYLINNNKIIQKKIFKCNYLNYNMKF